MEQTLKDKAFGQAASAQKRKAGTERASELDTIHRPGSKARSTNIQDNIDRTSREDTTEHITKKTKLFKREVHSTGRDVSFGTANPEEFHSTNQGSSTESSLQESPSGLQLCILPTVEPGSPAALLDGYAMYLFKHLFQIAKVGKMIKDMKADMETRQQTKTNVKNALLKDISDMRLRKFIVFACNTDINSDKLTPHRFVGPSSRRIRKYYPDLDSCKKNLQRFLWHLFIWRLFGFSRLEVIDKLYHATTVEECLGILSDIDKCSEKPLTVIGAYGNFRIPVEKRQTVLNGLYSLSLTLAQSLINAHMTFSSVLDAIETQDILFLQRNGLVAWLVVCDLAEWNLCSPPTVKELVNKIGNPPFVKGKKSRGGSGTLEALFVVQEACKLEFPFSTSEQLQEMLTQVLDALKYAIGDECIELQNRELSMADMEHMLCKISRASKIGVRKSGKQED